MKAVLPRLLALGALPLVGAVPAPGTSIAAAVGTTYAPSGHDAMLWPTDVAVDPTGRVWVADGAHDRVLIFAADGSLSQTLKRVAGQSLNRPMAVAASADGRMWIADAGNKRIAVAGARSAQESSITLGKELGTVDMTDLAVKPDGSRLWLVDNDGDRVLGLDVASGKWDTRGNKGSAWGSFNHPRSVAVDDQGRVYVTDILNGRVQRFDAQGRPSRPVVSYGVTPGHVFRPAGIDVDDGRLWVADSVMGVIEAFTADGLFLDALHEPNGNVLHLDHPIGIDVVGDTVYVVEAQDGRVRQLRLQAGPGAALVASDAKTTSKSASEGQDCTYCHLDLMAPLDAGVATALVGVPPKKNGASWAGTETACISCHDGAIMDSRDHIWSGYAHPRGGGAKIPATMHIPADIPLVDGQIACRTCHSPHGLGGSAQTHRSGTMLRVENRPSDLCVSCHNPKGGM